MALRGRPQAQAKVQSTDRVPAITVIGSKFVTHSRDYRNEIFPETEFHNGRPNINSNYYIENVPRVRLQYLAQNVAMVTHTHWVVVTFKATVAMQNIHLQNRLFSCHHLFP